MIAHVLERIGRRAQAADALWRCAERTAVSFESGRLKSAYSTEEAGVNLRVVQAGKVGVAGTTATSAADLDALVARALASAELGEALELEFPLSSPVPQVATHSPGAAGAPLDRLVELGRTLVERLAREGCQVNVAVERAAGEQAVGNTAGAAGAYPSTEVSVVADVTRIGGDDVLMIADYYTGTDLPGPADLDALVTSIQARLDLALTVVEPPEGSLPVVFTPAGVGAVLLPIEMALSGKAVLQGVSPLERRLGEQVFDARFSLVDDPLAPGRAGSRPLDDEGVPSRAVCVVERGVVRGFVYDLETAARAGARSTGHGLRGIFGKPRIAFTNLILGKGEEGRGKGGEERATLKDSLTVAGNGQRLGGGLLDGIDDGLVVDDLIGVGQGNVMSGVFSHPVGLAYRVRRGKIDGRVKDAAVAGNAYKLLEKIGGFGDDGRWYGLRWRPSLLLEGVSVARR